MTMTTVSPSRGGVSTEWVPTVAILAMLALIALGPNLGALLPAWLVDYPRAAVLPIAGVVGDWLSWLAREAMIGPIRFADITRGLAAIVEAPMDAMTVVFVTGIRTGNGADVVTAVQPVSWLVVIGLATLGAHMVGGARLALLTAGGLFYIVVFGFHVEAMQTVFSVVMSTAV